jgi:hypothetical protein
LFFLCVFLSSTAWLQKESLLLCVEFSFPYEVSKAAMTRIAKCFDSRNEEWSEKICSSLLCVILKLCVYVCVSFCVGHVVCYVYTHLCWVNLKTHNIVFTRIPFSSYFFFLFLPHFGI